MTPSDASATVQANLPSVPVQRSAFDSAPRRVPTAVAQALFMNVFVNRVDAWVFDQYWARPSLRTWSKNIRLGWEWDENNFHTNLIAHPYHGGLYFNAGRANGLDFWESAPLAFLGSWTWEYLGETHRPSLNDFFMTSFGGIALGEVFHRLGESIRDNQAGGSERLWREIAALPLDPMGGVNRLIRGQWSAYGPNPATRDPGAYVLRVHAGARFARGFVSDRTRTVGALVTDLLFGDPFVRPYTRPFDVFGVRAMFSGGGGFNVLRASGRLFGKDLTTSSRRLRHVFAVNQRFDYISNPAQSIGGQSIEAGIYTRWRLGGDFGLRTQVFGDAILLGAIDAPSAGLGERHYDFGPGAGVRVQAGLERRGVRYLTLFGQGEYIHSVSGASADHYVTFGGGEATLPIARGLGLAVHATYFHRLSRYSDRPDDQRGYPEMRVLLVWTKAGFAPSGAP